MPRFQIENRASQILIVDQQNNVAYFHLQEPFYTAGDHFHWEERTPGIGVNNAVLQYLASKKMRIRVFVGGQGEYPIAYEADPSKWLTFSFTSESIFRPPGKWKMELYELPWHKRFFETIKYDKDPSIVEAWIRLRHYEATGQTINAPLEGFS